MGKETSIGWTHHTFNPWWGCVRVSPGCEHCYAETFSHRLGLKVWGTQADRRFFGDKHWNEPLRWNVAAQKAGERRRVFCASMSDWLEDRPDLIAQRLRLLRLIRATPALDWLLLTKRPENFERCLKQAMAFGEGDIVQWILRWLDGIEPPLNVWVGTTTEDQEYAEKRIPFLLTIPAVVRFASYEPALGPVNFLPWLKMFRNDHIVDPTGIAYQTLDWVIVGGESGSSARPFEIAWGEQVVEAGRVSGASIFVKQLGSFGRVGKADGLKDLPLQLQVRQFPEVRHA